MQKLLYLDVGEGGEADFLEEVAFKESMVSKLGYYQWCEGRAGSGVGGRKGRTAQE